MITTAESFTYWKNMATGPDFSLGKLTAPSPVVHGSGLPGTYHNIPANDGAINTSIPTNDWVTGTPDSQAVSSAALQAFFRSGERLPYLYSLVVIRNGVLVGEQYYAGAKSSDLRHIASCTKTVGSLLIGVALSENKISGTLATLGSLLADQLALTPHVFASGITLQQLLDMNSNQSWDESTQLPLLDAAHSATAFALALPPGDAPGSGHWNYSTASAHLISPILKNAYGMDVLDMAKAKLFEPLGIEQFTWGTDPSGEIYGSFGLQIRTRDLAKIGWMSLQGGQWQGQTVVPCDWLKTSFATNRLTGTEFANDGALTNIGYGNFWWTGMLGGQEVILAWGHGGQCAILVPALQMVVATQAAFFVPLDDAVAHEDSILELVADLIASIT